jgi:hypothetical protein
MIMRKKNGRRPWEPEDEKQLREMVEVPSGKWLELGVAHSPGT